jgi:hypothetical protein
MTVTTFNLDAGGKWVEQPAGSDLDYTLDWSDSLDAGDQVVASEWVADAGLVANRSSYTATTTTTWLSGGIGGRWYRVSNKVTTGSGRVHIRGFRVLVRALDGGAAAYGPSVFADLGAEVAALRRDRLVALAAMYAPGREFSDEYLLGKLVAAEKEIERALRVFLLPREIIPEGQDGLEEDALAAEAAALEAAGKLVHREPGYDYEPSTFGSNAWGGIDLRHRPVIRIHGIQFHYPVGGSLFDVQPEWMRVDKKYGRVQFVPIGAFMAGQLGGLITQAISIGTSMPLMIRVRYRAGLEDVPTKWPDILSVIRRKAMLSILDELYLPSGGSVSGDGLAQSFQWKAQEHHDALARAIERLRQAIHGVELTVV